MSVDAFFAYARERHSTHLRRAAGLPPASWTADPILQQYRFCNVFRELDRTTIWFRENVRDPLRSSSDVLLATVLFRWFNRIVTGEQIFCQTDLEYMPPATPWEVALATNTTLPLRRGIRGKGPYVTGSYIIKTPDGMSKLDGVLWCVEQFMLREYSMPGIGPALGWQQAASLEPDACVTMEMMWQWLRQFPYLGDFMSYEVVTDLRHTALLERATDIMTWANPGPGAMRGLNRIHGRDLNKRVLKEQACREMQELLAMSQDWRYWPRPGTPVADWATSWGRAEMTGSWPAWEMREVEHTLCEFDKYERARLGEGRPRQILR